MEEVPNISILELLKKLKQLHPEKYSKGYKMVDNAEIQASLQATVMKDATRIPSIIKKYRILSVIYTNNSKETIKIYLSNSDFNFLKEFKIYTREDVLKPKPDPEGLISIVSKFQSKKVTMENTAYIGDSYIDAIAAHRAGMKFIWFKSRPIDKTLFPGVPFATLTTWFNFDSFLQSILV
jgi:phosphoglycolate phosphatase-like HAD superfamily hydrolase